MLPAHMLVAGATLQSATAAGCCSVHHAHNSAGVSEFGVPGLSCAAKAQACLEHVSASGEQRSHRGHNATQRLSLRRQQEKIL